MLNYVETTSISTMVPLSSVLPVSKEQETGSHPSLSVDLIEYVPLRVGKITVAMVSSTLRDGYLAARKAYAEMEGHTEYGAYFFLTGYEYAHLARQYMPAQLSPTDKHEWQRGFVFGWNVCTLGL